MTGRRPAVLTVFGDVCCPFTHAGLRRIVEARAGLRSPVLLSVRAWPLELVNGHPLDPRHVAREVEDLRAQVAPGLFTGFDAGRFPTTSIPAFGLAALAAREDPRLGEAVSLDLRWEVFERGRDVADERVLAELAARHGLPVPERAWAEEVTRHDWEEGRRRGVIGSPHFFTPSGKSEFCPVLDIEKQGDGHYRITTDVHRLEAFLVDAFGG